MADAKGKKPKLAGWQDKATRQPSRITAEGNSDKDVYREADGVLTPTGRKYGRWILDDDGGLERLEKRLGIGLRGITREITTPSGNSQLHFLSPEDGEEIRGSVGKHVQDGFEDVDVRGEGNLGLLPPSAGYGFGNDLTTIKAPQELVEWARNRSGSNKKNSPRGEYGTSAPTQGEPVYKGSRHFALMSLAGKRHDGTRDLEQLTANLHDENESFYPPIGSPGDDDPLLDVDAIARCWYAKEPCSPSKPPELVEMSAAISEWWYEVERCGLGDRNLMKFLRMLTTEGNHTGTVVEDGLAVSMSYIQAAERMSCHRDTIWNLKNRAVDKGLIRYDKADCSVRTETGLGSGAFVLLDPRRFSDTPAKSPSSHGGTHREERIGGGIGSSSRPHVAELLTEHYRHFGPVSVSMEETLCYVEAHPGCDGKELAALLGWTRPRDLERRHLKPLSQMGLIEVEDGRYRTPYAATYAERQEEVQHTAYSTVQMRGVRRYSQSEGRWVSFVMETGCVASQRQREAHDHEQYEADRDNFLRYLNAKREAAEKGLSAVPEPEPFGYEELVEAQDGEHPGGCQCPVCYYENALRREIA